MIYNVVQQTDGPAAGYETIVVEIEAEPGFVAPRHAHPGVESTYVIAGRAELIIDGQPSRTLQAGDVFQIPTGTAHSMKIGDEIAKACSILVVKKAKRWFCRRHPEPRASASCSAPFLTDYRASKRVLWMRGPRQPKTAARGRFIRRSEKLGASFEGFSPTVNSQGGFPSTVIANRRRSNPPQLFFRGRLP